MCFHIIAFDPYDSFMMQPYYLSFIDDETEGQRDWSSQKLHVSEWEK